MALINIEYGSLASSKTLNDNFQYLDNRISSESDNHITDIASINSNIVSINNSISQFNEETNENVENINTKLEEISTSFEENGLYITLYKNDSSWYKEYFSDKEKKNRVWLEQGGILNNYNTLITFIKSFSGINYIFNAYAYTSTNSSTKHAMTVRSEKKINQISVIVGQSGVSGGTDGGYITDWYACGY